MLNGTGTVTEQMLPRPPAPPPLLFSFTLNPEGRVLHDALSALNRKGAVVLACIPPPSQGASLEYLREKKLQLFVSAPRHSKETQRQTTPVCYPWD